jgi:outer membrane protein
LRTYFRFFGRYIAAATLVAIMPAAALGQAFNLDAMEELIRAGKSAQAYEQLQSQEDALTGQIRFDYLLGLAALESGHPDAATLAFERVLTMDPNFLGARLDIARAYYALGTDDLARKEFIALREANPPQQAQAVIEKYLTAIEDRNKATNVAFHVEAGVGHDTNISGATAQTIIFVPSINDSITLTSGTEEADQYAALRAGVDLTHKLTEQLKFNLGASAGHREYLSTDGQESTDLGVSTGVSYTVGDNTYSGSVSLRGTKLDFVSYQTALGMSVSWQHTLDEKTQVNAFLQQSRQRYILEANQGNDANLNLAGVGLVRVLDATTNTVLSLGAYGGFDSQRTKRTDGDRTLFGAQVSAQRQLLPSLLLFGSASAQVSNYTATNSLFRRERDDTELSAAAGVQWRPSPQWVVKPQVSYRKNNSNVVLNDYDRTDAGITVRWDF